jgi:small subunit ribosomal protein S2
VLNRQVKWPEVQCNWGRSYNGEIVETIQVKDMLEAGAHYGHQTRRWNPKMKPYIYGARNGIYILNLGRTAKLLKDAQNFLSRITARGEQVLFVATKRQARDIVREEAGRAKQPVVAHRWLGGTLTNFRTLKTSIEKLAEIERMLSPEMAGRLPKKELSFLAKQRDKLVRNIGGLRTMPAMPGAVFIVDPVEEHIAVAEARRKGIPIIALCDTNADPDVVDYIIPANDDAMRSIRLFVKAAADACLAGAAMSRENMGRDFEGGTSGASASDRVEVIVKPRHVDVVADEIEEEV